jgi:phosphoglycolate phosphatase-like HAD superfamily hydrolase
VSRRLVLFDIDGTLLLSGGAGRRAILAALADVAGAPAGRLDHIRFDGKTDPQIAVELLAAAGHATPADPRPIADLLDRYVVHLEADLVKNGRRATLMPGIAQLLDLLEAQERVVLGLLTGNIRAGAALKLHAVRLEPSRFRVGAFGSDHAERAALPAIAAARAEPHFGRAPRGSEIVIIGDTPADVTCGRSLGARSIGVATGSYRAADLRSAGADLVFDDFGDARAACRAILDPG